jgi:hypothetical protein
VLVGNRVVPDPIAADHATVREGWACDGVRCLERREEVRERPVSLQREMEGSGCRRNGTAGPLPLEREATAATMGSGEGKYSSSRTWIR